MGNFIKNMGIIVACKVACAGIDTYRTIEHGYYTTKNRIMDILEEIES